jgi:hypothetical protein
MLPSLSAKSYYYPSEATTEGLGQPYLTNYLTQAVQFLSINSDYYPPTHTEANLIIIPQPLHTSRPLSLLTPISESVYPFKDLMGSCVSCRSADLPTAKLVVIEEAGGLIREFPKHVKVEEILKERPGFFVCHADSMRYDEYVSPLSAKQELQLENLYFLLPLTRLRHPLPASDMVALAVEASAAMARSRRRYKKLGRRRGCKITPSVITMEEEVADIDHLDGRHTDYEIISSSSWRGEFKGEGFNSETLGRKRVDVGLRPRPVHYKLQRIASGRKRVNGSFNGPWRRKLSTIHEEGFHSLINIT